MIQRRIFSARSSLLRTRRIPDTPSSARLLLTENLSPLEPRYRGNIESPHAFLSRFGERELSTPFPFLLQKRKRCRAAKGKEGVGKPSVWFPHTPSIGQSLALDLRRMEVKKSTIEFVGADAERSCSRRRSVTDAACPLRVLIGPQVLVLLRGSAERRCAERRDLSEGRD